MPLLVSDSPLHQTIHDTKRKYPPRCSCCFPCSPCKGRISTRRPDGNGMPYPVFQVSGRSRHPSHCVPLARRGHMYYCMVANMQDSAPHVGGCAVEDSCPRLASHILFMRCCLDADDSRRLGSISVSGSSMTSVIHPKCWRIRPDTHSRVTNTYITIGISLSFIGDNNLCRIEG
jgi:hypothetical protein